MHAAPALPRLAALSTASVGEAQPPAAEDFYASSAVSFSSLGLSAEVCSALAAAGFQRPAHAQELAVPAMLAGRDAVLAAETGSGKTLAYVVPLVELALRKRAEQQQKAEEEQQQQQLQQRQDGEFGGAAVAHPRLRFATAALVLCPNAALCEQVVGAARSLRDPATGAPLASAALVSGQSPPPLQLPDLVVSTPGALCSVLDNSGTAYGYEWTRAGLPTWARCVVFDEADLLLSGGYGAQMRIIWDALRAGDRMHYARSVCLQVGLSEDEFADLPRHLKQAARMGGAQGLLDAGFKDAPAAAGGEQQQREDTPWGERRQEGVHGASWKRQYVFVAATMPAEGDTSVGAEIAARFPEAAWLSGRQLHQSKRAVEHDWRRVEDSLARAEVLQEVVAGDAELQAGRGRMLVFACDVASAKSTAGVLEEAGVPVLQYHKGVPQEERAAALERMGSEQGVVMVCTDAAARGLDVPDITHVVQADFAHSAVDFLHRVGRTARAGKTGVVTSLFTPEVEALVDAIRDNIAAGLPVEGAFSRKRSFRKKLRKYGEYVPRGQEGPSEPRQRRKDELASRAAERRSSRPWR